MPTSDQIFAIHRTAGFVHNERIVYALQYDLECEPPHSRCLIVWLTPTGDATAPWIEPAYSGKRIVTTKPGEHVRFRGKLEKVIGVSVYRSLPLVPSQQPLPTGVAAQAGIQAVLLATAVLGQLGALWVWYSLLNASAHASSSIGDTRWNSPWIPAKWFAIHPKVISLH